MMMMGTSSSGVDGQFLPITDSANDQQQSIDRYANQQNIQQQSAYHQTGYSYDTNNHHHHQHVMVENPQQQTSSTDNCSSVVGGDLDYSSQQQQQQLVNSTVGSNLHHRWCPVDCSNKMTSGYHAHPQHNHLSAHLIECAPALADYTGNASDQVLISSGCASYNYNQEDPSRNYYPNQVGSDQVGGYQGGFANQLYSQQRGNTTWPATGSIGNGEIVSSGHQYNNPYGYYESQNTHHHQQQQENIQDGLGYYRHQQQTQDHYGASYHPTYSTSNELNYPSDDGTCHRSASVEPPPTEPIAGGANYGVATTATRLSTTSSSSSSSSISSSSSSASTSSSLSSSHLCRDGARTLGEDHDRPMVMMMMMSAGQTSQSWRPATNDSETPSTQTKYYQHQQNGLLHAKQHQSTSSSRTQAQHLSSSQRANQCGVCGRNYARPSTLKTHLRTHTNERPFKCNVCLKTFSQAANLTAHQRVHTGERPFSCPICGRQFSQSSSVITHLRTHSGERPYRCSMCSRTFSDSSTLTKHCRIHSGEKPYQCDHCPLNFSQSGNLSRHLKLHLINAGGSGSSSSSSGRSTGNSDSGSSSSSSSLTNH